MKTFILLIGLFAYTNSFAGDQRLLVGGGLIFLNKPSRTYFQIGGEYEYRVDSLIGWGAQANHVFSDPTLTRIAAPMLYLHPLAGDWFVAAAPLFDFQSGAGMAAGARLATRVPLPLGLFVLVPSFSVDFIRGGQAYLFGLGLQF